MLKTLEDIHTCCKCCLPAEFHPLECIICLEETENVKLTSCCVQIVCNNCAYMLTTCPFRCTSNTLQMIDNTVVKEAIVNQN